MGKTGVDSEPKARNWLKKDESSSKIKTPSIAGDSRNSKQSTYNSNPNLVKLAPVVLKKLNVSNPHKSSHPVRSVFERATSQERLRNGYSTLIEQKPPQVYACEKYLNFNVPPKRVIPTKEE